MKSHIHSLIFYQLEKNSQLTHSQPLHLWTHMYMLSIDAEAVLRSCSGWWYSRRTIVPYSPVLSYTAQALMHNRMGCFRDHCCRHHAAGRTIWRAPSSPRSLSALSSSCRSWCRQVGQPSACETHCILASAQETDKKSISCTANIYADNRETNKANAILASHLHKCY